MGWFGSDKKKSKREELLDEIRRSKTRKEKFIQWLERYDPLFKKSMSWDDIIDKLLTKRKPTNKDLIEYIKSIRTEVRENKAKQKELEKKSRYKKGHGFEKKVARWAKRYFESDTVETNILVNGIVKREYEVDVHVSKERGFLSGGRDIWIECKNRKSSIKRDDVIKLVGKAEDVENACDKGREDFYFDKLAIVSTSKFDSDALLLAENKEVACFHYMTIGVPPL